MSSLAAVTLVHTHRVRYHESDAHGYLNSDEVAEIDIAYGNVHAGEEARLLFSPVATALSPKVSAT